MTTYAIADQVPADCDYLTAGKEYEVVSEFGDAKLFRIHNNNGSVTTALWAGSAHLNGGNWRRVEK